MPPWMVAIGFVGRRSRLEKVVHCRAMTCVVHYETVVVVFEAVQRRRGQEESAVALVCLRC